MLKLDIKSILNLPVIAQFFITIPLWVLIFYLAYFFDYSSLNNKLNIAKKKEASLTQELDKIFSNQIKIEKALAQVTKIETMIAEWHKKLINQDDVPDLLESVLKVGTANGLKFDELAREPSVEEGEYTKIPIKIVARGGFSSIARFMTSVANFKTLVAIDNISIKKQENDTHAEDSYSQRLANKKILLTNITLELYYLTGQKT